MIYCCVVDSNLSLFEKDNVLLFSRNIENDKVIKLNNLKIPTDFDFLISLKEKIVDEQFYFLDNTNGSNYEKYLEINQNPVEDVVFLQHNNFELNRVFYNLKDRFNFQKKYGKINDCDFPIIIKGLFLKEIINYIKLLVNYDVFYNKIDSCIMIIGKLIND